MSGAAFALFEIVIRSVFSSFIISAGIAQASIPTVDFLRDQEGEHPEIFLGLSLFLEPLEPLVKSESNARKEVETALRLRLEDDNGKIPLIFLDVNDTLY